jgi:hypothetical protein
MATAVTVGELHALIGRFADALEINNADKAAVRGLRDLCEIFSGNEAGKAATFLKVVGRMPPPTVAEDGSSAATIASALASLRALVEGVGKNDLNKNLDSLQDTLRIYADVPISAFVASARQHVASASKPKRKGRKAAERMDQRLTDDYVERLESALGDDRRFGLLVDELETDSRIAQPEAAAIASRFYGRTSNGITRSKALERIRERHEKLMQFKRQPSTAGRPAA